MNKQILIADESGDTGLRDKLGTSKYFTVGLVFFEDVEESKKCYKRIEQLKSQLGIRKEFKFTKTDGEKRVAFLKAIMEFDFYYFGVVIDKQELLKTGVFTENSFYRYACSLAFTDPI
jgi:hypothetical protein